VSVAEGAQPGSKRHEPLRVVFDCNVYFQALISPAGPSGRCMDLALQGRVTLFASPFALRELRETAAAPELRQKFRYDDQRIAALIENIEKIAHFVAEVPERFVYPRDPDDAHYINLALATESRYVVSRDNDLLHLTDPRTPEGREFLQRFPHLRVVQPPELLAEVGQTAR
jgi:putative PIN family toxin of toxin-antitoxin system